MKLQKIISYSNIGVYCRTEEQAIKLLLRLNDLGLCWKTGDKYDAKDTNWSIFRENTYYLPNRGLYGSIYCEHEDDIIDFEDVEFD